MQINRIVKETSGYVAASGLAFALDFTMLAVMVSGLGIAYLPAAAIAFIAGTLLVYWLSVSRIFAFRRLRDRRAELALFIAIGVIGLAVNLGVLYVSVDVVGLHYLLGKCCAGATTVGMNFLLRRWFLFTPPAAYIDHAG